MFRVIGWMLEFLVSIVIFYILIFLYFKKGGDKK